MRVAIMAPGEMGAAVGARLRRHGAEVATSSPAGAGRAPSGHGAPGSRWWTRTTGWSTGPMSCSRSCRRRQALPLAERLAPPLARAGGRAVYADCNAVAPETVRRIAGVVAAAGCPFADVGIIGGPPREDDAGPRLYASGEAAALLEPLAGLGLDLRVIAGGIGAASALKMAYATVTKGLTALGSLAALGASAAGVEAELRAELASSQPALLGFFGAPGAGHGAEGLHARVAEMEEIADFLRPPAGEAAAMFEGAARLYETVARDRDRGGEGEVATLRRFYGPPEG